MNNYVIDLFQRYRKAGILLDTNILMMYFVGAFRREIIPIFKRTQTFTIEDYYTLLNIISYFEKVVTTPNILTEVSNLLGQLAEHLKLGCFENFASGITGLDEHYLPSIDIAKTEEFKRFGITDAGILSLARDKYLVLTDDFRLSQYLQTKGVDVLNFNNIRVINWK